jgi:hypothetical protein
MRKNRSTDRKTCHSATLSSPNLTWNGLGLQPALDIQKPVTKASFVTKLITFIMTEQTSLDL